MLLTCSANVLCVFFLFEFVFSLHLCKFFRFSVLVSLCWGLFVAITRFELESWNSNRPEEELSVACRLFYLKWLFLMPNIVSLQSFPVLFYLSLSGLLCQSSYIHTCLNSLKWILGVLMHVSNSIAVVQNEMHPTIVNVDYPRSVKCLSFSSFQ